MFQASSAKRVRRDDLHSPVSSPRSSPDPDLEELLRSRAHNEFTFTSQSAISIGEDPAVKSDEDEVELRLFAAPSSTTAPTYKIRLSSPDTGNGEPGFLVTRPTSYYFAESLTCEKEKEYAAAAVDGHSVVAISKIPWPGCSLPWKVRKISAAGMKKVVLVGHPPALTEVNENMKARTRKSKKSRIAIRKKLHNLQQKKDEQAKLLQEKAQADREKRTRRNREKKVKKKMKEQAKKQAGHDTSKPADPAEAVESTDKSD